MPGLSFFSIVNSSVALTVSAFFAVAVIVTLPSLIPFTTPRVTVAIFSSLDDHTSDWFAFSGKIEVINSSVVPAFNEVTLFGAVKVILSGLIETSFPISTTRANF